MTYAAALTVVFILARPEITNVNSRTAAATRAGGLFKG